MTIYSLDILLSQFWTSPLFHIQFCFFLICIQVSQEVGKVVWYSHLFKNFSQFVVIHTVKGFGVANKEEVDVFLWNSLPFWWSSGFSKSSLNIWKFMFHILLKPSLKDFEHNLASIWNEQNYTVVWTFFGIVLLWDWNENWPLSVLWQQKQDQELTVAWIINSLLPNSDWNWRKWRKPLDHSGMT